MADFRLGRLKFNWRGAWVPSTAYVIDDIVSFKGNTYVCVVNHTSASSETAWASTDLNIGTPRWQLHVPGIRIMGSWTANTFYAVNDLISYGANQYLCVSDHTSSANENQFYLTDISNWSLYTSSVSYTGDWSSGNWYKLNDIAKYGNTLYLTTTAHTSGILFDETKFSVYLESVNFEDTWVSGSEYQPGDIVNYGGYTYIAETINIGKQPNIYNVDYTDPATLVVTPKDWSIVTTGFDVKGVYNDATVYIPGDVVQFGGNTYVKITTTAAGVYPIDTNAWSKVSSGLNWRGPWSDTATYQVNDVVSKQSASWVCLTPHNINIDPVADGGTNWQAVAQGESTLTLQDPGDILYRNGAGANVNLPIGNQGEILTVDENGLPAWERNNTCANVFYVTTDGVDDPDYGKNISKPWRTLRYALSQLPAGSVSNINTIFVKSGSYEEQLPLTVPEYTSIVGDNLRATIIKPSSTGTSTDPVPVENRFSTMFYLSESTTLKDLVFSGMEGFTPASGSNATDLDQATIRGVFLRLNPATPILGKSPYITQCSAFSGRPVGTAANCNGGVGAIVDRSIYGQTVSNGSMLFDSFTQFHDGGVGFWCKDLGNAEIVSCFTYYCHIGYACTGGARIRSLAGNNSWGTYGAVSSGFDNAEVALTGNVRGLRLNFAYNENSAKFKQYEEVVQGAANAVETFTAGSGTTIAGQANQTYTAVAATGGTGSGATFTVVRDGSGAVSSVTMVKSGYDFSASDALTILGSLVGGVDSTDDISITVDTVASDFSTTTNLFYARALILYTQDEYIIIEPITGNFTTSKPIKGDGSATVVASGALAVTPAGGQDPAVEGIKGQIFPLTNLPVVNGVAQLPRITGATKFNAVAGNPVYDDDKYYVIKEVVDASTASNLFLTALRQYDVPGVAPTALSITGLTRASNVATVTTSAAHGLSIGDKVTIVIPNSSGDVRPFATGYSSSDALVLGIRGGILQRTTVTGISGNTFTYDNDGADITPSVGLLTNARVYKQGTTGGSTKGIHLGGTSIDLYNVSNATATIEQSVVDDLSASATTITFSDAFVDVLTGITPGANTFLLVNNEMMNVVSKTSSSLTVTRGSEGTQASIHADNSTVYVLTKQTDVTTLRGDVDTAVTDIPVFSISNFDTNDIIKINNEFFRLTSVNSPQVGRATIILAQPKTINANNGQAIEIRLRYSQVRLTGHDFLQVGTGSKLNTNWPGTPLSDTIQANEVVENLPGRVYYVSTDQDGNFRVGEFFKVEQATGSATLDATAFDLSGLESLRLGTVGAELGVAVNEFSADATLGGDFARDGAVPTQLAVKTYVDGQVGSGVLRNAPTVGVNILSSSGTTATVLSFVAHNVYQGDTIVVSGANQANYNGEFVVTGVDAEAKTFTYTMPGTAVSPATGAITVERKQRVDSDLTVEGKLTVSPTWNTQASTEALVVNATNTQSGSGTSLIKAQIGGVDKFIVDKDGNINAAGNLTVAGTTTTVNSTNLVIADKEIIVGDGSSDSTAANGAGIQIGSSNLSFKYDHNNTRWNLPNAGLNIGGSLLINGNEILSSSTLASSVTSASGLTTIGTLGNLSVTGISNIGSVSEATAVITATSSGSQSYNFNDYAIVYHGSVNGNITAAWTSVPTTAGSRVVTIMINNGATPYVVNTSFGINGTSYNVKWSGGTAPTGKANQVNIFSFTILSDGSNIQVFGNMTAFG